MQYVQVIITSVSSVIAIFILTKLMGYKQVSQLSIFDYINGITIGSIAAEMATNLENSMVLPLLAMAIFTFFDIILSYLSNKSLKFRKFISGSPVVLFHNGEFYKRNFSKTRIDVSEFLTQCRIAGYFDLSQVQSVILEVNGQMSFFPQAEHKPVTPKDLQLSPEKETLVSNVIMDGNLMESNLKRTGNDQKWLMKQLKAFQISDVKEVFLATCDGNNQLQVFKKSGTKGPFQFFA